MEKQVSRQYIAIDLKSFYASVECVERGLDPLDTFLVVADPARTEKTICLAVSPALKSYGIGGKECVRLTGNGDIAENRTPKRNWTRIRNLLWIIW